MRNEVQREYGGALWMLALEDGCTDALLRDVRTVQALLTENGDYIRLIRCPDIPLSERLSLLDAAFRGNIHTYLLSFMKLLAERGHFLYLPDCLSEYCRRYNAENRMETVTVFSAVELSEGQKQALTQKLSAGTQKNICLRTKVDPALLGGLRVETESAAYDGTVRRRIETIRETLTRSVL